MKYFKKSILISSLIVFTAYANANTANIAPIVTYLLSDTETATPQEIAIDKIKAYADDQDNPEPTIQDYTDAGVTGVTAENIDDINSNIADKTANEVDTTEKIQAVVDSVVNAVSFANDVMPIFLDNCKSCHAISDGKTFKVDNNTTYTHKNIIDNDLIDTTSPDDSEILIKGNGGGDHKDKLSDDNSQIVWDWIEQGGLEN